MDDQTWPDRNRSFQIEKAQFSDLSESARRPGTINLFGNIEQALKGLRGCGTMALGPIRNADDAGTTIVSVDGASATGKANDYTAITAWGVIDRSLYLLDAARRRWTLPRMPEIMLSILRKAESANGLGSLVALHCLWTAPHNICHRSSQSDEMNW